MGGEHEHLSGTYAPFLFTALTKTTLLTTFYKRVKTTCSMVVRAQRIVRNAANAARTGECRRACPALHLSWRLRSPALLWTNILRVIQCVVFIHTSMFGKPNVVYEETRPLFIYKYACDFAVVSRARRESRVLAETCQSNLVRVQVHRTVPDLHFWKLILSLHISKHV